MTKVSTLKEQIQELRNQRHNIDIKISILQHAYNEFLKIHVGNIYQNYTEDAYIKVLEVDDEYVMLLRIDAKVIKYDWWRRGLVSSLKQLTELPKDIINIWKSRGIKLQIKK